MVQGKQLTVVWHVDDLKVSHVKVAVIAKMADWLKSTRKTLFEDGSGQMQISRGKEVHERLGVTLDFSVTSEVKMTMIPHVKEIARLLSPRDNSESVSARPAA